MKRLIAFLLALFLLTAVFAMAEKAEEGDDSNPVPLEAAEEAEEPEDEGEGDDSNPVPLDEEEPEDEPVDEETLEEETLEEEIVDDEPETGETVLTGRVLQYGDSGDDVLALQTRLKDLNYYTGSLSGKYGKDTKSAVESFQADFNLEQTGIADLPTLSVLYSQRYRPMRFGSTGEDVKELQVKLTELGYYKGKITGRFLEATQSAVKALQKKNDLEETGVADIKLQEMIQAGKILGKNDKPDDTDTPAPNLANYLVDDSENSIPVADEPVPFTKKLKSGSRGTLVKDMQTRLTELGYYEGPISGNFMKYTVRAVKAIQTQNGLPSTGVVDEATWNVIFNDPHAVLPNATPKPTPTPSPIPFHIVVDVANQVTSVYGRDENGEYTVVVRQMLCSTGMKATPSDVGDWVLNGRHATWCIFPKWGNSYARYWTRINSNIAFHSPIYTAVSNQAMKISSYNMLGQRASHGCIRLAVWDAKWIYDNIGAGTVVSIVEGMEPDPELRDALKLPPIDKKYCTPVSTPVPTAEPEYSISAKPELGKRVLKERSEGADVYWLQRTLKDLGYYDTKCTGKMLGKTTKAVKAFQKDHGLRPSGNVNQDTIDLLAETAAAEAEAKTKPATTPDEPAGPEATPAP